MWLFIAFLTVPLVEIFLFIQVGGLIGTLPTLGIVVLTAIIGTFLVRAQGRLALGQLRNSFESLQDPSEPLAHGAMILFSGALLLTPGFFTDAVGFALLVPQIRRAVFLWIKARVSVQGFQMGERHPRRDDVVEGSFTEEPEMTVEPQPDITPETEPKPKRANHPGSGWTRH